MPEDYEHGKEIGGLEAESAMLLDEFRSLRQQIVANEEKQAFRLSYIDKRLATLEALMHGHKKDYTHLNNGHMARSRWTGIGVLAGSALATAIMTIVGRI